MSVPPSVMSPSAMSPAALPPFVLGSMPRSGAAIRHQTSIDRASGLDAWLGTEARPLNERAARDGGHVVDWSAPTCPVALAYDTADQGLPSGVRVVGHGDRRLMFEADAYEVVVRVASDLPNRRYDLAGQVLFEGLPLPGAAVRLNQADTCPTVSTDLTGGFRLPSLTHGAYQLSIAVDGAVLAVPTIALS